jgi:hypothetical protein
LLEKPTHTSDIIITSETESGEDANNNFEVTVKANSALVCEDKAKTSKVHTKGKDEKRFDT